MRLAFVFTVLALLAGPANPATAQFRLGLGGPITGPNATSGEEMKNGAEQAVEDINAAGGVLGQKIQTTVGDDVSDPKQGASVANKFSHIVCRLLSAKNL